MLEFKLWNEDCVAGIPERIAENSIGLCVTSIPFGSLFTYSGKTEDVGNNHDGIDMRAGQFGLHMRFFNEQLFKAMMPGRNVCVHIQQLLAYKNQHSFMGRRDFRGTVVDLFGAAGFEWKGEVAIPKNPQVIAQRLKLHSLMFITGKKDATGLAPAVNDYVMIFQKPGENPSPVRALHDRKTNPKGWVSTEEWIKWASGVWGDIRETDVLENWQHGRDKNDEKHVCPLQLELIRRCVKLYSNPGDWVMDPFMGIGSTGFVAIEQGRNACGFELKESYCNQATKALTRACGLGAVQLSLIDANGGGLLKSGAKKATHRIP